MSAAARAGVHGRVVDPFGEPVAGARVTCASDGGAPPPVETDEHGSFGFEDVAACVLVAYAGPHAESAPLDLAAGALATLRLRAPAALRGTVRLDGGGPVTSFDLWLRCLTPPCQLDPIQRVENAAGEFEVSALAPGGYELVVRAPDHAASDALTVTLAEGEEARGLVIMVPASGV